jgi:alkylhydroperoxidase family enzyme
MPQRDTTMMISPPALLESSIEVHAQDFESVRGVTTSLVRAIAGHAELFPSYMTFSEALTGGRIDAGLKSRIGLRVGALSSCPRCQMTHTHIAGSHGIAWRDQRASEIGLADDAQATSALEFAAEFVASHGDLGEDSLERMRASGFDDGQIGEILAFVALLHVTHALHHT